MVAPVLTLYNGAPAAVVPADCRAAAYGDGLFETLMLRDGRVHWLEEHLARLVRDGQRLGLDVPERQLRDDIQRLLGVAGAGRQVLKLMLWRRSGGRGYAPASRQCERLVALSPAPADDGSRWQQGVRVQLCRQRLSRNPALAGIKHLNRLEQVLASAELSAADEGLMTDDGGRLIEGTKTNLFLVRDGELLTPALTQCGVAGIVRAKVLAHAQAAAGRRVTIKPLSLNDLYAAQEVFLTNSLIGIWPVVAIGCHHKPIGPVTNELQQAFEAYWHG